MPAEQAARGENKVAHCNDESYAEASFYIGLIRWQQSNYEQALGSAAAAGGGPEADKRL